MKIYNIYMKLGLFQRKGGCGTCGTFLDLPMIYGDNILGTI